MNINQFLGSSKEQPNRWLHLKHPDGFDDERFTEFEAHCQIFKLYVQAVLANAHNLSNLKHTLGNPPTKYIFFQPELSADKKIVTLPISGNRTLGTRSFFEDRFSWLLWHHMPNEFKKDLEEGVTEDFGTGNHTNWRKPTGGILLGYFKPPWE